MASARTKASIGLVWEASTRGGLQVLSWLSTILVARILFPEDYGLVAISGVFTGLVTLFSGFGINAAIVNRRIETLGGLKGAFIVCAVSAFLLYALLFALSSLIADYYEQPRLAKLVVVAGIVVVLSGLQLVPAALASVALAFKFKAIVHAIGQLANIAVTLTLAVQGYGYWSLIIGVVLQEAVVLAILWSRHPVKFDVRACYAEVRSGMRYSLTMMSSKILGFVSSAAPNFVASVVFSTTTVGLLALSMTLAFAPVRKIGQMFNGITFATVSSNRSGEQDLATDVMWLLRYLCVVSFPALIGFYLVADDVIYVLLSEKWGGAAPVVKVWCLVGLLELMNQFSKAVVAGSGDAETVAKVDFAYAIVLPVVLILGASKGLIGMAYGMLCIAPIVSFVLLQRVLKITRLGVKDAAAAVQPAIVSTLAMFVVAQFVVQPVIANTIGRHTAAGLVAMILSCIVAYGCMLLLFYRGVLRDFRRQLKSGDK